MKRIFPHPILSVCLLLIWLLLVNSAAVGQIVLGAFIGWLVPLCCRGFLVPVPRIRRPIKLGMFMLKVMLDIVKANFQVARLVLGPQARLEPAFIELPLTVQDEFVISFLSCVVSLTPGTVSASLSDDRKTLLLHALDASHPEAMIAEIKQRYEAPLLEIFECSAT